MKVMGEGVKKCGYVMAEWSDGSPSQVCALPAGHYPNVPHGWRIGPDDGAQTVNLDNLEGEGSPLAGLSPYLRRKLAEGAAEIAIEAGERGIDDDMSAEELAALVKLVDETNAAKLARIARENGVEGEGMTANADELRELLKRK